MSMLKYFDSHTPCRDAEVALKWEVFCNTFKWLAMNNALVELNKILLTDLEKSEEILDHAGKKFRGKIKYI